MIEIWVVGLVILGDNNKRREGKTFCIFGWLIGFDWVLGVDSNMGGRLVGVTSEM